MNVSAIQKAIDDVKKNGGDGIVAMDIFGRQDSMAIAGFNTNPQACALFNRIFSQLIKSLEGANFPTNLSYYTLMLEDGKAVFVGHIKGSEFMYGMLTDFTKIQQGMLTNIILPQFIKQITSAINE
ncbi:hypothetical protein JXR93_13235 [bacterium]|nr:hypothetical protein [bacterium]